MVQHSIQWRDRRKSLHVFGLHRNLFLHSSNNCQLYVYKVKFINESVENLKMNVMLCLGLCKNSFISINGLTSLHYQLQAYYGCFRWIYFDKIWFLKFFVQNFLPLYTTRETFCLILLLQKMPTLMRLASSVNCR